MKDRDTGKTRKRPVVFFENDRQGSDPKLHQQETLVAALGKAPAGWLGASVGIFVDPNVMFGGQSKAECVCARSFLLRRQKPAARSRPAPRPTTKPPAAAASEWPEEKGDPGADPGMADFEPAE